MPSWEKKQQPDPAADKGGDKQEKTQPCNEESVAQPEVIKVKEQEATPMHFYPPLPRAIVPLDVDNLNLPFGAEIECRLHADWFKSRTPTMACQAKVLSSENTSNSDKSTNPTTTSLESILQATEGASSKGRVKGTIIRLKINTGLGFDMTEISLNEQYRSTRSSTIGPGGLFTSSGGEDAFYYCDTRELRGNDNGGGARDKATGGAHVGDIVEFVRIDNYHIAACPVLLKASSRMSQNSGVPSASKRNVVNMTLRESGSAGVKSITMAEGPQGDSIGFAPGWRGDVDVTSLPWGHLLSHLTVTATSDDSKEFNDNEDSS
jgi:hypothetical protein